MLTLVISIGLKYNYKSKLGIQAGHLISTKCVSGNVSLG